MEDNIKTGLILEGGAMRGLFTCGIIDVFLENNITFDGMIGVSAGAVFGCNYKSKQHDRPHRYNLRFCDDDRYCSFKSLLKTGDIYGAEFCYDTIPYELDPWDEKAFAENPMEFYAACTDVETGKPVYKKLEKGNSKDIQWLRASASMPIVSKVVEIDGRKLLDGGVADSIPLKFFERRGYNKNVVVLTQPWEYRKSPNKLMFLARIMLRK